jgi:hypothetical protein
MRTPTPPPRVSRSCVRDAPPPTPAFWQKSLEVIENKGRRAEKEGKERKRVGKSLKQ